MHMYAHNKAPLGIVPLENLQVTHVKRSQKEKQIRRKEKQNRRKSQKLGRNGRIAISGRS